MDNYKSLKTYFYLNELKNMPKPPQKEKISLKNLQKKSNARKNLLSPKKYNNHTRTKVGNVIKETIVFNVPNRNKGRSLEKVPLSKTNQSKNLYINYLDLNQNKKRYTNKEKNHSPKKMKNNTEISDSKKFNSVCVSINNNYNYNLSLGNANEKTKEKGETWQDKFNRINKQRDNLNYLDYKKLTETDFFKNKFAKKEKEEKQQKLNKTENNFEHKLKELNSAPAPNIQNINFKTEKKEANTEIKNAPKKKTGILGFLQAFKDLLEPINRKKNNNKNINENNNKDNNINNISNINNKISVNLKVNQNKVINIPSTPRIENENNINNANNINNLKYNNFNSVNTTPKINLYERKNILHKKDTYNDNDNYYSDYAYDSCPIANNNTYPHKNINNNDNQILSYSHKNIFKNDNIYMKGRTNFGFTDKRDYYNSKTEIERKDIRFNNNTYTKKSKRNTSPIQLKTYDRDYRHYKYEDEQNNNNIFANYLNDLNTPISKPMIKKKLLGKFNDDYNEENLEENLNINAEKKIQEIKINIKHKKEKINNSAIYKSKKAYNNIDDLIMNPKPQNKIESCVINFNQNKTDNSIYYTPKTNYNKKRLEENYNDNNNNYNYNDFIPPKNYDTYNGNEIYTKPINDLSQSQRNLTHKINIDSDSDNKSTNSAFTSKPIRKKIILNKSERISKTNNNQESDSESNSEFSEFSQTSTKSLKPNTIYFKPFRNLFNKNKKGTFSNNFLKKIFKREHKKYENDESFNSENNSSSSFNSFNITNINHKISNKKLHLFKKIYNYNITLPRNIIKGNYVSKSIIKPIKLPKKKASMYTKYYYKLMEKPKVKMNYIDKKRIKIKEGINIPLLKENYYFIKQYLIKYKKDEEQSFENDEIININEEIKNNNKKYFSPDSPPQKEKDNNSMVLSPQFGTKREPSKINSEESPVLNLSKSARDINKIISIEIDLDNKNNIQQNTPIRNSNMNIKGNQSETLYIKKKPSMKKLNTDDTKYKTYIKNINRLNEDFNMREINPFNIDSNDNNKYTKKNNKIISIDINLKKSIKNTKINNNTNITEQITQILNKINNIKLTVDQLLIIITFRNNIRLPFMEILSNEYTFAKIIIKKALDESNQKIILNYAIICQQLCFRLNANLNTNETKQVDEDLKTIISEECKLNIDNILHNNYNINDNELFGIVTFIAELINLKVISINLGFYCYENIYHEYKSSKRNKYYFLDIIISLLNKIGKNLLKEKKLDKFNVINTFIDNELMNVINSDMNLPLFLKNKIVELINNKRYQWTLENK